MTTLTILWMALPFFVGFNIYLFPQLSRVLALGVALCSVAYGLMLVPDAATFTLHLLDYVGISLVVDPLSGYFILTNALVTAAVTLYCWQTSKSAFFYTQMTILHGSVNAIFICADFISLYVALEAISIAVFLLIAYPRTDRSIWVALRYLFVSNITMLFYLIGAVLVYQANQSFAFIGLQSAPTEAVALILLGLFTKGGLFISGLWLPLTHSEADTPVSALLSGSVVKTGLFPLVRCALLVDEIQPILTFASLGTIGLGIGYGLFERDTKRLLAFSTISQLGFVLVAPAMAGFYALTHGLAKAGLFLITGNLPSRNLETLQATPLKTRYWIPLILASLSIAGFPLLAGFGAKSLTLKSVDPWQSTVLTVAAVGTATIFAKFMLLPFVINPAPETQQKTQQKASSKGGLWIALTLLIGGLFAANSLDWSVYTVDNIIKSIVTVGSGLLIYRVLLKPITLQLPRGLERLEQLIGMMSLVLASLSWMVLV